MESLRICSTKKLGKFSVKPCCSLSQDKEDEIPDCRRHCFEEVFRKLFQGHASFYVTKSSYRLIPMYGENPCVIIYPREAECLLYCPS